MPLPGVITNEVPPSRAMPAWNEASVRSEGLKNTSPSIFPAKRARLRVRFEAQRQCQQCVDLFAAQFRQVDEPFHVQPAAGAVRPVIIGQVEQPVHPLHRAARRTLVQIVDGTHDGDRAALGRRGQMRIVARDDVLDARSLIRHSHERRAGIEITEQREQSGGIGRLLEARLNRAVYAPRKWPGVRDEGEFRIDARCSLRAGRHFRCVAVRQRVV